MKKESLKPKLEPSGVKRLVEILFNAVVMSALLFLSAGRLDWWPAWAYLASWILFLLGEFAWMFFVNPAWIAVLNMRGKTPAVSNTKPWDRTIILLYIPLPFLMVIIGGLDAGRYGWSSMPLFLQAFGFVLTFLSYILPAWAVFQNAPSLTTRVGIDKRMQICSTGPYAIVRHPMYAGILLGFIGIPLLLGSYLALIPGLLSIALFIARTIFEDRDLQAEVPAYREYAKKVRSKLVPGVW